MSEQVKRYDIEGSGLRTASGDPVPASVVDERDYDALAQRCRELEDESHRNRVDYSHQVERCDSLRAEIERLRAVNRQLTDPIVRANMLAPTAPIVVEGGLVVVGMAEAERLRATITAARDKLGPAVRNGHPALTELAASEALALLEAACADIARGG